MHQYIENGSVTSAKGFKAAGIHCGIKRKKKDLALIYSETPCSAAGTFTLNKVKAAPLLISQEIIGKNPSVKAVLVNSGNANACTGDAGYNDALESQKYLASKLGIKPEEILLSSTGVIGQRMPVDKLFSGIDQIIPQLSFEGGLLAAEAIMTTDTKMKNFALNVKLSTGDVVLGGICKGSGMIMPNMATMLGFMTTDLMTDNVTLQSLLRKAVSNTFNKISVDGETSTNDMVVLLANGAAGVQIADENDKEIFYQALEEICREMAKSIVSDGEGATKLVTVNITGAHSEKDADLAGKTISNSSLVKTAIYGRDANWGRIMSAIGMSGADISPEKVSIYFDDVPILLPDFNIVLDEAAALNILSRDEFSINVNLNGGQYSTTWWTCDFTEEYVKINADYRT